jgi:hypothetical protein
MVNIFNETVSTFTYLPTLDVYDAKLAWGTKCISCSTLTAAQGVSRQVLATVVRNRSRVVNVVSVVDKVALRQVYLLQALRFYPGHHHSTQVHTHPVPRSPLRTDQWARLMQQ